MCNSQVIIYKYTEKSTLVPDRINKLLIVPSLLNWLTYLIRRQITLPGNIRYNGFDNKDGVHNAKCPHRFRRWLVGRTIPYPSTDVFESVHAINVEKYLVWDLKHKGKCEWSWIHTPNTTAMYISTAANGPTTSLVSFTILVKSWSTHVLVCLLLCLLALRVYI